MKVREGKKPKSLKVFTKYRSLVYDFERIDNDCRHSREAIRTANAILTRAKKDKVKALRAIKSFGTTVVERCKRHKWVRMFEDGLGYDGAVCENCGALGRKDSHEDGAFRIVNSPSNPFWKDCTHILILDYKDVPKGTLNKAGHYCLACGAVYEEADQEHITKDDKNFRER